MEVNQGDPKEWTNVPKRTPGSGRLARVSHSRSCPVTTILRYQGESRDNVGDRSLHSQLDPLQAYGSGWEKGTIFDKGGRDFGSQTG